MIDATQRFSSRVANYVKYRPTYPPALVEVLKRECQLTNRSVIADVASGTGILTQLFLKNGNPVFAIEPNREMREAAERLLKNYPRFHSVDATAEATGLENHSVDFITAGQAFHWFDGMKAREEFFRILKPDGWVVLVWNDRRVNSPFEKAYEQLLLDCSIDYQQVNHRQIDESVIGLFFSPGEFERSVLQNRQTFDFEGLKGRLLSSSYVPETGHSNFEPMLKRLRSAFDEHEKDDKVSFDYDTTMFYGRLPTKP